MYKYYALISKIDGKIEGAQARTVWAKIQEAIEQSNRQEELVKLASKTNTTKLREFFKEIGFSYWDNMQNSNIIDSF